MDPLTRAFIDFDLDSLHLDPIDRATIRGWAGWSNALARQIARDYAHAMKHDPDGPYVGRHRVESQ